MKLNEIYYKKIKSNHPKGNILLLHGLTGDTNRWRKYVKYLKKNYNLLLIDLIGHGNSDSPKKLEEFSQLIHAKKILQILKKEKIKKVICISHSYSAGIALEMIKKSPSKLKSLIMISPLFLESNISLKKKIKYIKVFARNPNLLRGG